MSETVHPVSITPQLQMGVPRVGVRDYFTMEHLWNARHMAELCVTREAELADAGFHGIDREVRAFAVGAVLGSVAFLEALVNSVWQDAADHDPASPNQNPHIKGLSAESVARLREQWESDRTEWLPTLDKYQLALKCADKPTMNLGAQPGQIVAGLILFRHRLTHFKPAIQWAGERHELEQRLGPHIPPNPLLHGHPWFPHQVRERSQTRLRQFAQGWDRMGFTWDDIGELEGMAEQIPSS